MKTFVMWVVGIVLAAWIAGALVFDTTSSNSLAKQANDVGGKASTELTTEIINQ